MQSGELPLRKYFFIAPKLQGWLEIWSWIIQNWDSALTK